MGDFWERPFCGIPTLRKGSQAANPIAALPDKPITSVGQVYGASNRAKMVPGHIDMSPGPGGAIPDLDFEEEEKSRGRMRTKRVGLPLPRGEKAKDPYLESERKRAKMQARTKARKAKVAQE